MADQNIQTCQFCGKGFKLKSSLYKHYRDNTDHKPKTAGIRTIQDEVSELLAVETYHRHARIRELLRQLTQDEITAIVTPFISKMVPTYDFMMTRVKNWHNRQEDILLRRAVQKEFTLLSSKIRSEFADNGLPPYSEIAREQSPLNRPWKRPPRSFIEDLNAGEEEVLTKLMNVHQELTAETVITMNAGKFCSGVLMPKIQEHFSEALLEMNVGIMSSFSIGQKQYQDVLRNYWGKKLAEVTGLNPFLPKAKVIKELNTTKEMLRREIGLQFISNGKIVAAYTNIAKHIEFLLRQPGVQGALSFPKNNMVIYDYMDEFSFMGWSHLYTGKCETTYSYSCVLFPIINFWKFFQLLLFQYRYTTYIVSYLIQTLDKDFVH